MSQSTYILGSIIAGFVIFITVRGELPRYMGFLIGTPFGDGAPTPFTNASGAINPTSAGGSAASYSAGKFATPFNSSPSSPGGSSLVSDITTALDIAAMVA